VKTAERGNRQEPELSSIKIEEAGPPVSTGVRSSPQPRPEATPAYHKFLTLLVRYCMVECFRTAVEAMRIESLEGKMSELDVWIVEMEPMRAASAHGFGTSPEEDSLPLECC
jgi:hypothetical protein